MDDIPQKIFLDTNVVNFILEYGEQILDGEEVSSELNSRIVRDIDALQGIWMTGMRAQWQIVISATTFEELLQTKNLDKREALISWGQQISIYQNNVCACESYELPHPITTRRVLSILPDAPDRELLTDAMKAGCDAFCTRDWKTLLRFREKLSSLPLRIMAPHEWWESIRPFGGLWA